MRRWAALAITLLLPLGAWAQDDDPQEADRGQTRSLDSYDDTGETRSLDSVDNGQEAQEEDVGEADNTGRMMDLGAAKSERPQPVAAPAPVPEGASAERRAEAQRIREEAVVAARRLDSANAAYSQMMSRGHPAGDERAKIIQERDAARKAWEEANARYTAVLDQMGR
jgi:hypothetical protein